MPVDARCLEGRYPAALKGARRALGGDWGQDAGSLGGPNNTCAFESINPILTMVDA